MSFTRQGWLAMLASLGGCVLLAGCQGPGRRNTHASLSREDTPKLNSQQQADLQVAFARSLEKNGASDQAKAAYEDALKKDPLRADALDRLAVMHARKGQFEQAVALHKKALAIQPSNPDFVCNLGYSYYLQQRWAEAEIQFRKAIELAPSHSRAFNNLGLVLARTVRSEKALAAFRQSGCSEADAHSNLAFALTLENSWKEAQEHYARARDLDPASGPAVDGLRVVNAQLNRANTKNAKACLEGPTAVDVAAPPIKTVSAPTTKTTRILLDPARQPLEFMPESAPQTSVRISDSQPKILAGPPFPVLASNDRSPSAARKMFECTPAPSAAAPMPMPNVSEGRPAPAARSMETTPAPVKKSEGFKQESIQTSADLSPAPMPNVIGTTPLPNPHGPRTGPELLEPSYGVPPVIEGASSNR